MNVQIKYARNSGSPVFPEPAKVVRKYRRKNVFRRRRFFFSQKKRSLQQLTELNLVFEPLGEVRFWSPYSSERVSVQIRTICVIGVEATASKSGGITDDSLGSTEEGVPERGGRGEGRGRCKGRGRGRGEKMRGGGGLLQGDTSPKIAFVCVVCDVIVVSVGHEWVEEGREGEERGRGKRGRGR